MIIAAIFSVGHLFVHDASLNKITGMVLIMLINRLSVVYSMKQRTGFLFFLSCSKNGTN